MSNTVKLTPPGVHFDLRNYPNNTPLDLPRFPARGIEITGDQSVHAVLIPTSADISFDPVDGTASGATAVINKNLSGSAAIARANFLAISARKKDNASAALLGNTLTVRINNAVVAILNVNEETENPGWIVCAFDGSGDDRYYLGPAAQVTGGSIEADDETYTKSNHGIYDGQKVTLDSLTGGTGVTPTTDYYFHRLTANTGTFHATYAAALAGTSAINVSLDASSVVLTPQTDVSIRCSDLDVNLEIHFVLIGSD